MNCPQQNLTSSHARQIADRSGHVPIVSHPVMLRHLFKWSETDGRQLCTTDATDPCASLPDAK